MSAEQGDGLMLDDESERLPWLEPAEPIEEIASPPLRKMVGLVLLFLLLLALVIGGGWLFKSRLNSAASGEVALIAAPGGPYKIPANEAEAENYDVDGKTFDGEGDTAFAASEGGNSVGRIDASKAPETPMTDIVGQTARAPAAAVTRSSPAQAQASAAIRDAPATRAAPSAKAPVITDAEADGLSGQRIQLGAYESREIARDAWRRLGQRFEELGSAKNSVSSVKADGRTLFRLRMAVTDKAAAKALCGRLRVAGESCWVVP